MTRYQVDLPFRPLKDLHVFDGRKGDRATNLFRAKGRPVPWSRTRELLDKELVLLGTVEAFIQVSLTSERGVRQDGELAANATVNHPGVVLTTKTKTHGTLVYPCDAFDRSYSNDPPAWQINARAIAVGLESLRRVERYGIAPAGQQYAGWKALPSGTAMDGGDVYDDVRLAQFLATAAGWETPPAPTDLDEVRRCYRDAMRRHHPDVGGSPQMASYLNTARDALGA